VHRPVAPVGSERLVEVPWVLSRYRGEARVLDVGTAYAEAEYVAALEALGARQLVGVDLARPQQQTPPSFPVARGDVRRLPFAADSFDLILCVSTLEHVGRDNSVYGLEAERDEEGMLVALRELRRILARRGRLLLTVPCGELEDHGWFVQQPPAAWLALFRQARLIVRVQHIYELGEGGWRRAHRFREQGVRYGTRGPAASAVLCADLRRA
jgi:SAM-dependent methyltransferase